MQQAARVLTLVLTSHRRWLRQVHQSDCSEPPAKETGVGGLTRAVSILPEKSSASNGHMTSGDQRLARRPGARCDVIAITGSSSVS